MKAIKAIYKKDLDRLQKQNAELLEALKKSVEIIKTWHGDEWWSIYYEKSPEMKPIREILKKIKS